MDLVITTLKKVENFDLFEKLTDYVFEDSLNIDPKEMPVLFSEPSIHNKDIRCKITESMFEKYGLPAMFICKSAVLSAFSLGRSSCLVLDSGHYSTYSTPIHDGYVIQKSIDIKFNQA
jgi:actin-like protein 6A